MATHPHELRTRLVALLPRMRRYAYALAGHRADADDLVQAAIVRALSHEHAASAAEALDAWMYRTIRNLRVDERRRAVNRRPHAAVETIENLVGVDGLSVVETRSELAHAQRLLDAMNSDLRTAAVLVIVEGWSYRQVAEHLQIPMGTVMSRVSRARRALVGGLGRGAGRSEAQP